jgi:hypothetical protein
VSGLFSRQFGKGKTWRRAGALIRGVLRKEMSGEFL